MAKYAHSKFFSGNYSQKDWYKFRMAKNFQKKIWIGYFWPFQIYTSLRKIYQKKFGMAILFYMAK